jgi:hypothetical protein
VCLLWHPLKCLLCLTPLNSSFTLLRSPAHVARALVRKSTSQPSRTLQQQQSGRRSGAAPGPDAAPQAAGRAAPSIVPKLPPSLSALVKPLGLDSLLQSGSAAGSSSADATEGTEAGSGEALYANTHDCVTLLFADIQGFTTLCSTVTPQEVMQMLNALYLEFDRLTLAKFPVYKVETIGDCYVAATGLLHDDPNHAATMLGFANAMLQHAATVPVPRGGGATVRMRVGIHTGPVVTGVVGLLRKRYCLL